MDRRTVLGAATCAIAARALLPATAWAQAKPETSKLALGFGLDPVFAPHMVAMSKGWFRDAGFTEVTTKTFSGGAIAGEALVADEIQLWTPGNLPPISMAHNGVPIVVLGTNAIAAAGDKLVVRKDANIKKPEEQVEFFTTLPHGTGKKRKICALVGPELEEKAKEVMDKVITTADFSIYSNNFLIFSLLFSTTFSIADQDYFS